MSSRFSVDLLIFCINSDSEVTFPIFQPSTVVSRRTNCEEQGQRRHGGTATGKWFSSLTDCKRAITVTATAGRGKAYGDADHSLGYSVSDLGGGAALVGALDRAVGEDVGSYAIGQGTITNA